MFALVLFVCYLDGGCEDIVVDIYDTEQHCLYSMDDQRIRHGGCFPVIGSANPAALIYEPFAAPENLM